MQDDLSATTQPADRWAEDVKEVLLVVAPDPELDPEVAERVARHLWAELAHLDVEELRPGLSAPAPDAAKGSDAATVGAMVVALAASGVFTALIETVRDWLGRSSARHSVSLTIDGDTIELERAADSEREALIRAYIRRHTDS
ncbi:effector-associated constant component EACC1 [Streptomyces melanogenes]|uniref:effector-associated constant component EACC1 n=1 Tax=Streptomyces melanogenes TaxID=67326 RepID=UPI00167DB036|nr:hypothetical protein [Streptomyces melanogenes]GGP93260.1 hypothetical protein GCM10010278_84030 [Streptomyces melanogenes]